MITFSDFTKLLENDYIVTLNNNSNKNIVLFGNCHMSTIGYMLNVLLNYSYNIHIIIPYYYRVNINSEYFD
jgi:hypothetical protein